MYGSLSEVKIDQKSFAVKSSDGPNGRVISCVDTAFANARRRGFRDANKEQRAKGLPKEERTFTHTDAVRAAMRTGKNIMGKLQSISERWNHFLTVFLPLGNAAHSDNDLVSLKNSFSHFCLEFRRAYPNGWLFYWIEVNKAKQYHIHMCIKTGTSSTRKTFECWASRMWGASCRSKFSSVRHNSTEKKLARVTDYHMNQAGYAGKHIKRSCRVRLAGIAHELGGKTFGFIGKKNCSFVSTQTQSVDTDKLSRIAQAIASETEKGARNNNRIPNALQIARVRSGNFKHYFVSPELWATIQGILAEPRRRSGSDRNRIPLAA